MGFTPLAFNVSDILRRPLKTWQTRIIDNVHFRDDFPRFQSHFDAEKKRERR